MFPCELVSVALTVAQATKPVFEPIIWMQAGEGGGALDPASARVRR